MHDAFYLADVATIEGEKLTALTYIADLLLVGTASGKVLALRVTTTRGADGRVEHRSTREKAVELSRAHAVSALEAAPDLGVVVALCDGAAIVLRLPALERVPSVLEGKNAAAITFDAFAPRLCIVTTKKRLKVRGATTLAVFRAQRRVWRVRPATGPPPRHPPHPPAPPRSCTSGRTASSRRRPRQRTWSCPTRRAASPTSAVRCSSASCASTTPSTRRRAR